MPEDIPGFFEWVATTRRVTDTPRGDFVQDTKDLWRLLKDEAKCGAHYVSHACAEAKEQGEKLRRQYKREFGL